MMVEFRTLLYQSRGLEFLNMKFWDDDAPCVFGSQIYDLTTNNIFRLNTHGLPIDLSRINKFVI